MFSRDNAVWLIGSVCQLHRIPFAPELLVQQFPPPYAQPVVQDALRAYGFKVGERPWPVGAASAPAVPCIAFLKEGGEPDAQRSPSGARAPVAVGEPGLARQQRDASQVPALIVSADAGRVLYFRAGSDEPHTIAPAQFADCFNATFWMLALEPSAGASVSEDPDAPAQATDAEGNPVVRPAFGFRWFIPELLRHRGIWRDVLLASLAIQVVGLTTPLMTQVIIDKVVVHQTRSTLWVVAVALVVFMLFSAIMTWLRQYLVLHTGTRIDAVLGAQVFRHLFRLPMQYFEHRPTGTLVARVQGVENIRNFVSSAAVTLVLDCPFLVVFLAVMFWYSWQLTLIAVALLVLIGLLSLAVTPLFRSRLDRQFLLGARNQAFVTEYVSGMATVKSLQMEPVLERRYGDFLAQYLGASFSTRTLSNGYNVIANALEQTMTLAILVAGALLVMEGANSAQQGGAVFTIGMLVAFQMFASRMSQPMLRLVGLWQEFQQASISVKRLGDLMDAPAEPFALKPRRAASDAAGAIEFHEVSFRYSDHHPYLFRHLNLKLQPGRLTVLMGPSGCGKSTLAKLLLGFYPPSDGVIRIDGHDIGQLSANELRGSFGVVPQETVLFSGTVYDNLLAANPQAAFEDIAAACRQAGIDRVIEALPQGYQTSLGEQGVGLSGGQRQRIAIARALLKRPKVLIFDEATSNLDRETAEQFAQTVNQLKGRVTMLFIAHAAPDGLQVDDVVRLAQQE